MFNVLLVTGFEPVVFPQLFSTAEVTVGNNTLYGCCCGRDFIGMVDTMESLFLIKPTTLLFCSSSLFFFNFQLLWDYYCMQEVQQFLCTYCLGVFLLSGCWDHQVLNTSFSQHVSVFLALWWPCQGRTVRQTAPQDCHLLKSLTSLLNCFFTLVYLFL